MQLKIFLATIFGFGSGITGISKLEHIQYNNVESIIQNYKIENEDKSNEDITIHGQEYGKEFRLFINSAKNAKLPNSNNSNDYVVSKAKKDVWYNHLIKGIEINVLDYSSSKEDFIKHYGILNIKYEYMFNFWNGKEGWTYTNGINPSYADAGGTYQIKGQKSSELLIEKTDPKHSSNESARIFIYEEWIGNKLSIKIHLGTKIHWAWGSIYDHASLAQMKNDEYTFSYNEKGVEMQTGSTIVNSNFQLGSSNEVSGIDKIDDDLKTKKADFGISTFTNQFFFGTKIVGNKIYFVQISILWFPNSLMNIDSSAILTGLQISRNLYSNSIGNCYFFTYKNNLGLSEKTNSSNVLYTEIKGMNMTGTTQAIYAYGK